MSGLAETLKFDGSIRTLEAAAPWRWQDAETLRNAGRLSAAAYLFGYVAEMRLTAACFHVLGYNEGQPIRREQRKECEKEARALQVMSDDPHDLRGWARYLVYLRKREMRGYNPEFRDTLIAHVDGLYDNWRPRLRYRALNPNAAQLNQIRSAAEWLNNCYTELWS